MRENSLPDMVCPFGLTFPPKNEKAPGRRVSPDALRAASLTVEAAWALPLFFLAALSLIFMMEIYGTYAEKTVRLQEQAETLAVAAAAAGGVAPPYITLMDSFEARPRWYPEILPSVAVGTRARVHTWSGRSGDEEAHAHTDEGELVYVSDYQSVYHTSSSCTHLALSVTSVSGNSIGSRRNIYGARYHACEKCVGSGAGNSVLYITPEGSSFHNSAECSGLNRTVRLVEKSEVCDLPLCSRCAAAA